QYNCHHPLFLYHFHCAHQRATSLVSLYHPSFERWWVGCNEGAESSLATSREVFSPMTCFTGCPQTSFTRGREAGREFGGGQALPAIEPAEEIGRGLPALLRIALEATGN